MGLYFFSLICILSNQHKCLLNMGTADLYGSNDPFQVSNLLPSLFILFTHLPSLHKKISYCLFLIISDRSPCFDHRGCRAHQNRLPTAPRLKISSSR